MSNSDKRHDTKRRKRRRDYDDYDDREDDGYRSRKRRKYDTDRSSGRYKSKYSSNYNQQSYSRYSDRRHDNLANNHDKKKSYLDPEEEEDLNYESTVVKKPKPKKKKKKKKSMKEIMIVRDKIKMKKIGLPLSFGTSKGKDTGKVTNLSGFKVKPKRQYKQYIKYKRNKGGVHGPE